MKLLGIIACDICNSEFNYFDKKCEIIKNKDKKYHKQCFKCTKCKK